MAEILEYTASDTRPKVQVTLTGVDITGFTFRLLLLHEDGVFTVVVGAIVTAVSGIFDFTFSSTDLTAGTLSSQIEITDTGGGIQTFEGPRFEVAARIGDVA